MAGIDQITRISRLHDYPKKVVTGEASPVRERSDRRSRSSDERRRQPDRRRQQLAFKQERRKQAERRSPATYSADARETTSSEAKQGLNIDIEA